jgi:hypothetical protein
LIVFVKNNFMKLNFYYKSFDMTKKRFIF